MSTNKVILGVLGGLAVGALAGVLFAPDEGKKTRKKIINKGNDYASGVKGKLDDMYNTVVAKCDNIVAQARQLADSHKQG